MPMMLLLLFFGLPLASATLPPPDPFEQAPAILASAQRWKPGDPLPPALLTFRESGGCFGSPTDTTQLLSEITNTDLLVSLVAHTAVAVETREEALKRGLYTVGPNAFFAELKVQLARSPQRGEWVRQLRDRMSRRHVVVDGLFIDHASMTPSEANRVLDRIETDLRRGQSWQQVYESYANEFGYSCGTTTKIGNLGDFVVFPDPALRLDHHMIHEPGAITYRGTALPRRLSRLAWLQDTHVAPILAAKVGDVLRLDSPDAQAYVLYHVREVYPGQGGA